MPDMNVKEGEAAIHYRRSNLQQASTKENCSDIRGNENKINDL
jgi:hypothetical protein